MIISDILGKLDIHDIVMIQALKITYKEKDSSPRRLKTMFYRTITPYYIKGTLDAYEIALLLSYVKGEIDAF